jgi:predicted lipoprotein with Yx(FWY)xxD motif
MQRNPPVRRPAETTMALDDRRLLTRFAILAVATGAVWLLASSFAGSAGAAPSADQAKGSAVVKAAKTNLGPSLVDAKGRTLYLLTADKRANGKSVCYGECAKAWPPLLTKGTPKAGPGAKAALLGVASRTDGTKQVTYDGKRLYLFVKDKAAHQTNGQKLRGFGGPFCTAALAKKPCIWYALSPDGTANTATAASARNAAAATS